MSSTSQADQSEDETQLNPQSPENIEESDHDSQDPDVGSDQEGKDEGQQDEEEAVKSPLQKKKRERKEVSTVVNEPGKSLLPFARVQRIIKADKDIPIVAKEATFLISLATEEFIKRLCEAGQQVAFREKRSTVQHKDIATVVRKADEFLFLEEIMSWSSSDAPPKRSKPKGTGVQASGPTLLDQFVNNKSERQESEAGEDVVMDEDGTMFAAGSPENNNSEQL